MRGALIRADDFIAAHPRNARQAGDFAAPGAGLLAVCKHHQFQGHEYRFEGEAMITKGRSRRRREPLDIQMTLKFKFGSEPADVITVMDNKNVPLVGSIFEHRDRLVRAFTTLLVKNSLSSPKVIRELFPALRALRRRVRS